MYVQRTKFRRIMVPVPLPLVLAITVLAITGLASAQPVISPSLVLDKLILEKAEQLAITNEPGLSSRSNSAEALRNRAIAMGELPDPKLKLGVINLPTDTYAMDQDPMNQIRLGISQQLSRGKSRQLKRDKTLLGADKLESEARSRLLHVLREVRLAWLDLYYWITVENLVVANLPVFEQLRNTTGAQYRVGRKSLQDVIRSELELQRLNDRLTTIASQTESSRAYLSRWVGHKAASWDLPADLPEWTFDATGETVTQLASLITNHPEIEALQLQLQQAQKDIELVEQNYKPNWGFEVAYSTRQAKLNGETLPDLFSASVTVDLPFFTSKRQDKLLRASQISSQARLDQKLEHLRNMVAQLQALRSTWSRLEERIRFHKNMILPQTKDQAAVALLAYEADKSDFAEVMRARIADLEAKLEFEQIRTDSRKTLAKIYYFVPRDEDRNLIDQFNAGSSNLKGEGNE